MKNDIRAHLKYIRKESDKLLTAKYIKGSIEHKGDLTTMGLKELIDEALDENTDQRVYLLECRRKLKNKFK